VLEKIEVDRAMEALTPSELLRLQRFADYRVLGLGRAARGRTGKDLLNEAQLRTLIGAGATRQGRHWNKHVDFVWHLTGAMRSISSGWKRQFKEKEPCLMSETLIHDAEGHEHSPLDNKGSVRATAEHLLIEKDEEDRILAMFKDDPKATQVLQGLLDGLKKNEIMSKYGLDEKQYAATVKRILKLLGPLNGGSKGIANCPHVNLDRPVNTPDGPPMPSEHRAAIDEAYMLKDRDLLLRQMASPNRSTSGYANQMYDALKVERGGEKDDR
jgi:hypothetical protein